MPDDEASGGEPDARPADDAAASTPPGAVPGGSGPAVTPSGYAYEVVDGPEADAAAAAPAPVSVGGVPLWAVALAAIVPALIVGVAVWFFFGRDDGGGSEGNVYATSLLNAFTAGNEGVETTRYEGELPPGYPEGLPEYEDAPIIGSVVQLQGDSVGFIAVHDAGRSRDDVAAEMRALFDADPWQIDLGQDGRETTVYQFTRIDDPDISGLVLLTESKGGDRTTIITSVQQASGGGDREEEAYTVKPGRPTPDGFPTELPVFEGAVLIEAAFQNDATGKSYALTYIVKAEISDVIAFYRDGLENADLTVTDGDASASALEDAELITFNDEELELQGEIAAGVFPEDEEYTQIDVQVGDQR